MIRTWIRGRRNCKLRMLTSRPYTFALRVVRVDASPETQVTIECNIGSGSQLLALTFSCFVFRVPAWGQEAFPPTRDVGCLLMVGEDKSKRSRRDGWSTVDSGGGGSHASAYLELGVSRVSASMPPIVFGLAGYRYSSSRSLGDMTPPSPMPNSATHPVGRREQLVA